MSFSKWQKPIENKIAYAVPSPTRGCPLSLVKMSILFSSQNLQVQKYALRSNGQTKTGIIFYLCLIIIQH